MTTPTSRKLAALVAAAALAMSAAEAHAADNIAVATNTRDDSSVYRIAFKIVRSNSDVVDDGNAAVAAASCSSCQTVAVAMETVLLFDDPEVFTPTNLAIAQNVDCSDCQTLASAYQTFVQTGEPVHFTAEGNQRIADIRRQLKQLRNAGLSIVETQATVDALNAELNDVLANELVAAGPPPAATTETAAPASEVPAEQSQTEPAPTETTPAEETSTPTDTTSPETTTDGTGETTTESEDATTTLPDVESSAPEDGGPSE